MGHSWGTAAANLRLDELFPAREELSRPNVNAVKVRERDNSLLAPYVWKWLSRQNEKAVAYFEIFADRLQ